MATTGCLLRCLQSADDGMHVVLIIYAVSALAACMARAAPRRQFDHLRTRGLLYAGPALRAEGGARQHDTTGAAKPRWLPGPVFVHSRTLGHLVVFAAATKAPAREILGSVGARLLGAGPLRRTTPTFLRRRLARRRRSPRCRTLPGRSPGAQQGDGPGGPRGRSFAASNHSTKHRAHGGISGHSAGS